MPTLRSKVGLVVWPLLGLAPTGTPAPRCALTGSAAFEAARSGKATIAEVGDGANAVAVEREDNQYDPGQLAGTSEWANRS
jgi:hypothetical protein